jgi:hypothetical protein
MVVDDPADLVGRRVSYRDWKGRSHIATVREYKPDVKGDKNIRLEVHGRKSNAPDWVSIDQIEKILPGLIAEALERAAMDREKR